MRARSSTLGIETKPNQHCNREINPPSSQFYAMSRGQHKRGARGLGSPSRTAPAVPCPCPVITYPCQVKRRKYSPSLARSIGGLKRGRESQDWRLQESETVSAGRQRQSATRKALREPDDQAHRVLLVWPCLNVRRKPEKLAEVDELPGRKEERPPLG